jgi:DNA mismatch repair ATPase MutS
MNLINRKLPVLLKRDPEDINFEWLYKVNDPKNQTRTSIDMTTWHDLEMNEMFVEINHCMTSAGEEKLTNWLLNPTDNEESYNQRKNLIDKYSGRDDNSKVISSLSKVGFCDYDYRGILFEKDKERTRFKPLLVLLSLIISVAFFAYIQNTFTLLLLGGTILATMAFHYLYKLEYKDKLHAMAYISKVANFYVKNTDLIKDYKSDHNKVEEASKALASYMKTLNYVEGSNPILEMGLILTLNVERTNRKVQEIIDTYREEILECIDSVGLIDVLNSTCKLIKETDKIIHPNLIEGSQLEVEGMINPLIKDCVSNPLSLSSSMIITGSNMSGKSTYLRTVGINILLAQALCISYSERYSGPFYKLVSAISLKDDLNAGKSYFMMEAEAIKRMLQINGSGNVLYLIDEIFKGTNPIERLAASVEILNELSLKEKVIVTTHDLSILDDLKGYDNYYFEHYVDHQTLQFDHHIKEGISDVRNAIKLMEYINYPESIINNIYVRMDKSV